MRCALRRLLRGESDDVAPVGDVARAPPPESTPAFAYRHLAEEPVAATLLLHREVVDRAGHLRRRDSDGAVEEDRKSTRLNSSHVSNSYAVFCLKNRSTGRGDSESDEA